MEEIIIRDKTVFDILDIEYPENIKEKIDKLIDHHQVKGNRRFLDELERHGVSMRTDSCTYNFLHINIRVGLYSRPSIHIMIPGMEIVLQSDISHRFLIGVTRGSCMVQCEDFVVLKWASPDDMLKAGKYLEDDFLYDTLMRYYR